jgi:hypothetical protein
MSHQLTYNDKNDTIHVFEVPTFKRITKDRYWELLECVPPRVMANDHFLVGEAADSCPQTGNNRYDYCVEDDAGFLMATRPISIAEYQAMQAFRPALRIVD